MVQEMVHERACALLGAYAPHALGAEEHRLVEGHLDACIACAEELPGLQRAAAALRVAAPVPSPLLWARIRLSARRRCAGA